MMRTRLIALASVCTTIAVGQTVTSVYNRDTHDPFQLKNVSVESYVIGPMVVTSTWLDYENPYKTRTEATLNFDMPTTGALGGFAYLYGDEYVPGRLMDKNKAWFIYTAITSRNRDPGIMEQWSPTTYHCQIFPIKEGHDLRVRLWSVGLLEPQGDKLALPRPQAPMAAGYEVKDGTIATPTWVIHTPKSEPVSEDGKERIVDLAAPVSAVAQKFRDGRVYVAGLFQRNNLDKNVLPPNGIQIEKAFYEPKNGTSGGADVTAKVMELIANGSFELRAENATFGDPAPNVFKRLRVKYRLAGEECEQIVPEHATLQLLSKENSDSLPHFSNMHQVKTVSVTPDTVAFFGWVRKKNQRITANYAGRRIYFMPQSLASGNETPRLWAQQMLADGTFSSSKQVLAFSLKYGVPSNATALLAVPEAEIHRYLEKEKEWMKLQAQQRRRELAQARGARNWAGQRNQNWNASGGGDPEIRVVIPGARSVEALLPDKRVLSLSRNGDTWGGNFEIPSNVAEGTYEVKILAQMEDGSESAQSWTYNVDRTPPKGTSEFVTESGKLFLVVKSEPKLAEVAAYDPSGNRWVLHEDQPGVYRVEIPSSLEGRLVVVLKDRAGNRSELACSRPL